MDVTGRVRGGALGGWVILQTYVLSPGDGGVSRPFGERLAFGAVVAALGLAFAGGMTLFAALYVLRLTRDEDEIIIDTLTPWGVGAHRHSFVVSDLGKSTYHHGRSSVARSTGIPGGFLSLNVDAPWITLHATERRLPFLLDLQAETIDTDALTALAEAAVVDWQEDRG